MKMHSSRQVRNKLWDASKQLNVNRATRNDILREKRLGVAAERRARKTKNVGYITKPWIPPNVGNI